MEFNEEEKSVNEKKIIKPNSESILEEKGKKSVLEISYMFIPIVLISLVMNILSIFTHSVVIDILTFISFCSIGALAVFYEIPEELGEKIAENKALDIIIGQYFELGEKVNEQIKKAIDLGSIKGALLFVKGMFILFLYTIGVALLDILISLIKSIFTPSTTDMFSGFSWLFGAGVAALLRWFIILRKDKKEIDLLAEERKTIEFLKSTVSFATTIYVLIFGIAFWSGGLILTILFSTEQYYILPFIILPIIIPFLIYVFIKIIRFQMRD